MKASLTELMLVVVRSPFAASRVMVRLPVLARSFTNKPVGWNHGRKCYDPAGHEAPRGRVAKSEGVYDFSSLSTSALSTSMM